MKRKLRCLHLFASDERGLTMVEYAIAGALIAAVAAAGFQALGGGVTQAIGVVLAEFAN
jgi:Flp pilus assembly pilin Flp